mmetsp:Transcript_119324/g.337547  ORF Transcript_119324/g.337547 Transcript_119324/m.337547 type:complete len:300 (-) Transcript_119324:131-1030(-)
MRARGFRVLEGAVQELAPVFVAVFSVVGSYAHATYQESGRACSLIVHPGTAEGLGALQDSGVLLEWAFSQVDEFRPVPTAERLHIDAPALNVTDASTCKPSTYLSIPIGEVLEHQGFGFGPSAHVHDLGAGFGRPVMQAVLAHGAAAGLGVELSETRWRTGCDALRRLDFLLAKASRRPKNMSVAVVELRRGDMLDADVSDATHVFIFATCFPASVVVALQEKLMRELPLGARVFCVGERGLWPSRLQAASARGSMVRRMLRADVLEHRLQGYHEDDDIMRNIWRVDAANRMAADVSEL